MPSDTIVKALRSAFASPGDNVALRWKNSENSAYRKLVSGGDIDSFGLGQSGLCCFDLCLFAGFSFGNLDKATLKTIYKQIDAGGYNDPSPLISGALKTVGMPGIGGEKVGGPDVVNRWPLAGELVFFRKAGLGPMAHVAYALDGVGTVISFGHKVPADALRLGHSQADLNRDGLMQMVEETTIATLWPMFNSAIYCAPPAWDP